MARNVLNKYSSDSLSEWIECVLEFDSLLQQSNGKLNPGTTADLLACALFIKLIKESYFSKN